MKIRNLCLGLVPVFVVLMLTASSLAVPRAITYQGLLSEDGVPVTGTKSVTFRIYDVAEGGTDIWNEEQIVEFENGTFGVVLGSVTPIPIQVFDGSPLWLSVTIESGSEMLPRIEIVSVGYAFHAETAEDATTLDGRESWEYAGASHTHDSRYHTQSRLSTTDGSDPNEGLNLLNWDLLTDVPPGFADGVDDAGEGVSDHGLLTGLADDDHPQYAQEAILKVTDGDPPNQGTNQVHWDNLTGLPPGFADGVDNTTSTGGDHGALTGLEDDDHPQYAQESVLQASDGTGPNEGSNQVHWNNLGGVPSGFADSTDDITTNASLITSGAMAPERITGTAVTQNYGGLLTESEKDSLTGGGITDLHYHQEIGDISAVTAGQGLTGGGISGAVAISHDADASALRNAHHPAPIVVHRQAEDYVGGWDNDDIEIVTSLTIEAPDSGYLHISFSGMQVLDLYPGVGWEPARYIAEYGVSVDSPSSFDYFVRSSMYDTDPDAVGWVLDQFLPQNAVAGTTVKRVDAGSHTVFLLTDVVHRFESEAENRFYNPSLAVTYFPFGSSTVAPPSAGERGAEESPMGQEPGSDGR